MPSHWTYEPSFPGGPLQQGDIIRPNAQLLLTINEFAHYFSDPKYVAFAITTQTCDMVLRNEKCSSPYITLSPIRLLREMLQQVLESLYEPLASGIFSTEFKFEARKLLDRIVNQNEQALGLFYLHPDADLELGEAAVIALRVGIALRSCHYDEMCASRIGRLKAEYQSRLGWMVGNLYSRVAVPGWEDRTGGKRLQKEIVNAFVNGDPEQGGPIWVRRDSFAAAVRAGVDPDTISRAQLADEIAKYEPRSVMEQLLDRLDVIVNEFLSDETAAAQARKLTNRIRNDSTIRSLLARAGQGPDTLD